MGLNSKQLLWLFLNFNALFVSFNFFCFYYISLKINKKTFYMDINSDDFVLQSVSEHP